jgi:signal transduction histidine kinase
MDGRGTLEITVRPEPAGEVPRSGVPDPDHALGVLVEICDSGPGIPDAVRARMFEPFFTTKDVGSGSGLGLHIVRSIVERHAGRIEVTSAPGRTCFQVTLPARVPPAP